ncbi:Virulence factor mviN [Prochlorococcus sp. SS52]|nr:Virulence factor mviN [Prochlorococcus marinus str. LG]KGG18654.1 Virulence factor mviN [Prochlorococcus marinus str. SS2]KGG22927.1 Virulence factor mviN [Prochlorococcus marinus str. SS35]KGG34031.1 Virulence factor mviN [Prochlorococcus marinus str. SS51]KGG37488.1 Virulence factor mviN [Prochlorococcus sp. SS52]
MLISLGTVLSKTGGLARQVLIAGVFGVGAAYDAFNYAYILPGFFLILIGGINGPLHNAVVTVLSRRSQKEGEYIMGSINTSIIFVFILISGFLFLGADSIIQLVGPGLDNSTHLIAVKQLKIMSPITLFAGLIGIGFGSLNARDKFFIPSISPIISSLALIIGVSIFWAYKNLQVNSNYIEMLGGIILAQATLIGAIIQWVIQIPLLKKEKLFKFKFIFDWRNSGVKEVWKIILPATFASGMLQVNVFTDLFFASNILGAAAGLSYANFLVQAPLGLVSNALLLPLLPTFAKLTLDENQKDLIMRIRQGFIFSSASMICLGAIFIALSKTITETIFGRGVFNNEAIQLVSGLLVCYGIGMPAYLIRDLLVRVFYAFSDGDTPFKISTIGIALNAFLDWFLIGGPTPWGDQLTINLGANGLVLATVGVNILTCSILLLKLKAKITLLPLKEWLVDLSKLFLCGLFSGLVASKINSLPLLSYNNSWQLIQLLVSIFMSLLLFCILSNLLGIKEVSEMVRIFKSKLNFLYSK